MKSRQRGSFITHVLGPIIAALFVWAYIQNGINNEKRSAKAEKDRQEELQAKKLAREKSVREAIEKSAVMVGMTADEARQAWGDPSHINTSTSASGDREQWVYTRPRYQNEYIYLVNGVVSSIQTTQ